MNPFKRGDIVEFVYSTAGIRVVLEVDREFITYYSYEDSTVNNNQHHSYTLITDIFRNSF